MTSFLSDSYPKPKLTESRLVNKIIKEKNNNVMFEDKAKIYIKNLFFENWKLVIGLLIICILFFWRYIEIKNIRNKKKTNKTNHSYKYEEDSEDETSEE